MEQQKSKGGRPPKAEGETFVQRSVRLLPAQWEKFDAAGAHLWLRDTLDAMPAPPKAKTRKSQK